MNYIIFHMQNSSNSFSSSVNLFVELYQVMVYSNALNNHKVYETQRNVQCLSNYRQLWAPRQAHQALLLQREERNGP